MASPSANCDTIPPSPPLINIKNFVHMVLDFSNHLIWTSVFVPVLESHGVIHHIDGTTPSPPQFISTEDDSLVPNPVFISWKRTDAMVLSWIQATVSIDVLRSFIQPGVSLTAREAWLKISNLFHSHQQSQEVQYKRDFVNFKKGSLSMVDYVTQLKALADSLFSINVPISERDVVTQLCTGLPQEYLAITTCISTRVPLPSFIEARSLLLNFEAQLKSFAAAPSDLLSPAAFFAPKQPSSFSISGTSRGRGGRGRGRNQPHPSGRHHSILGAPPVVCQYCNKQGHYARDCYQLQSKAFYVDSTQSVSQGVSSSPSLPFDSQWQFDIGATSHMTPHLVKRLAHDETGINYSDGDETGKPPVSRPPVSDMPADSQPHVSNKLPHNLYEILKDQLSSGIYLKQKTQKFWVDKNLKNCFMLYARGLVVAGGSQSHWHWPTLKDEESSEASTFEAAELLSICWLQIDGKFETFKLSPATTYGVVFILMIKDHSAYGWETPVNLRLTLPDKTIQLHMENLNEKQRGTWIEIPVGVFMTSNQNMDNGSTYPAEDMEVSLYEIEVGMWKKGLVIKGVCIRPKINP